MPDGSRKKILMVIPNLGFGGAQRVFHDLAVCLSAQNEVIECVFNFDNGHAYPTKNRIISLDVPGGKGPISKLYFFILRVIRLRKLKKSLRIQYSISHLEGADYVNILSKAQERVILCIHGSKLYDQKITGWLGWLRKSVLLKLLYRRADEIVTVANGIKDEMLNFGVPGEKVRVINNGFDLYSIREKAKEPISEKLSSLFDGKRILITHGRLAEEKDQATLIQIMRDMEIRKHFRLVIIGDGTLRDGLVAKAKRQGLNVYSVWDDSEIKPEHEVVFLGFDPNPFAMLSRASLYLFPSLYEGFPLALGEAMACGLPVISRNCYYGPGDIINPCREEIGQEGYLMSEFGILISNDIQTEEAKVEIWTKILHKIIDYPTILENYKVKATERSESMTQEVFCDKWMQVICTHC
jgi:glycosyltransferase involved in cell wall biosynthesis